MVAVNDVCDGNPLALAQPFLSQRAGAQAQGGVPQQPREYLDLTGNIEAPIQPIPVKATDGKWYLTIREGKVRSAQRFAIDFNKVDAAGNILPSPYPAIG